MNSRSGTWKSCSSPSIHASLTPPRASSCRPMTRGFSPGGAPTDEVAAYYQRRAKHEVGLIITEGTFIDEPSASPSSNYPNFFGGAPLRGWKKVLEAVHTTDCKIAPQLWHVGMARPFKGENLPNPELPPIGPSGIDVNTLRQTTDPMSAAKIEEVIDAFARAAADAQKAGIRRGGDSRGPRLPDRPVFLEGNQQENGRVRGRPGGAHPLCQPHHSCRPQGGRQPSSPLFSAFPSGKPGITTPSWRVRPWNWKIS